MKHILLSVLVCVAFICHSQNLIPKDFQKALRYGAKARITVKVIDEENTPIHGAFVSVYFRLSSGMSTGKTIKKKSDYEGIVQAESRTSDRIFINVSKEGYYSSSSQYKAQSRDPDRLKDNCWLPWNPTIQIVLRKIKNPIPMYVTTFTKNKIPLDTDLGFDCKYKDFIPPFGKGVIADFNIRITAITNIMYDNACQITFLPKDTDGGFIKKEKVKDSFYLSEYNAPTIGYESFSIRHTTPFHGSLPNSDTLSDNEYLIFRSRIIRDQNNLIISANYGKIYGKLDYWFSKKENGGYIAFTYYFNPNANDTNLEFTADYRDNLFGKDNWEFHNPILLP